MLDLTKLNKSFESRMRLGIMSVLAVNDEVEFTELKNLLVASDGNLSSHLHALEKVGYVKTHKQFVGRKPKTTCEATPEGMKAFKAHLSALEELIRS